MDFFTGTTGSKMNIERGYLVPKKPAYIYKGTKKGKKDRDITRIPLDAFKIPKTPSSLEPLTSLFLELRGQPRFARMSGGAGTRSSTASTGQMRHYHVRHFRVGR